MHFCLSLCYPALPILVWPEDRLSFCSVLGQNPLWVLGEGERSLDGAKSSYPSCALPGQSVFPCSGEPVADKPRRDARGCLLVVEGDLAGKLQMPVGQELLHLLPKGRSLQIVLLDCSFHIYNLHQKNGFTCMLIGEIFELM